MPKKGFIDTVRVDDPCTEAWDKMIGNDQVRFCSHCSKSVNNLSAMTRKDAMRIVRRSRGRVCIRYVQDPETGAPLFSEQLVQIVRRAPRVAAGVIGASLSLSTLVYAQGGSIRNTRLVPLNGPNTEAPPRTGSTTSKTSDESETTAVLTGTIFDTQGAVVPGATVALVDANGNEIRMTSTNDDGKYKIERAPLGQHQLTAIAPGFRKAVSEIDLRNTGEKVSDITLDVAYAVSGMLAVTRIEYTGTLIRAVDDDDIEKVRELIAAGEDVNGGEEDGSSPLIAAVKNGSIDIVRLLIDLGADVNGRQEDDTTPIMLLDDDATAELVDILVRRGARVNDVDEDGDTALTLAAGNAKPEVLQALIDAGADINARNSAGYTALMNAADEGSLDAVRVLLTAGADPNLKNKAGETAWDLTGNEKIENLLVKFGAIVDNDDDSEEPE